MSKPKTIEEVLDNLLQDFTDALSDDGVMADPRVEALQAIEDIMNEQVIGENGELSSCPHGSFDYDAYCIRGKNRLRDEQRANLSKALRGDER